MMSLNTSWVREQLGLLQAVACRSTFNHITVAECVRCALSCPKGWGSNLLRHKVSKTLWMTQSPSTLMFLIKFKF